MASMYTLPLYYHTAPIIGTFSMQKNYSLQLFTAKYLYNISVASFSSPKYIIVFTHTTQEQICDDWPTVTFVRIQQR